MADGERNKIKMAAMNGSYGTEKKMSNSTQKTQTRTHQTRVFSTSPAHQQQQRTKNKEAD